MNCKYRTNVEATPKGERAACTAPSLFGVPPMEVYRPLCVSCQKQSTACVASTGEPLTKIMVGNALFSAKSAKDAAAVARITKTCEPEPTPKVDARPPCRRMGRVLDRIDPASGEQSNCQMCWVRECDLHGKCTTAQPRGEIRVCASCPDWQPDDAAPDRPPATISIATSPPTTAPTPQTMPKPTADTPVAAPPVFTNGEHPKACRFAPPSVREIGVGITTAPRPEYTLGRSATSIVAAGFVRPIIGVEPLSKTHGLPDGCELLARAERLGAWRNFMQTLRDVLRMRSNADTIAMFQDDIEAAPDTAEFLRRDLWPSRRVGMVSIYAPTGYEKAIRGCRIINGRYLVGACAVVFPRPVAEQIATDQRFHDWRGAPKRVEPDPAKKKAIDTFLGHAMAVLHKQVCYYTPSLAQHFSKRSALGHGPNVGNRRSRLYAPASAFDTFKPEPIRWTIDGKPRHAPSNETVLPRRCAAIIPHCDQDGSLAPMLTRCLDRLWTHDRETVAQIWVIDNGSSRKALIPIYVAIEQRATIQTTIVPMGCNAGFPAAINRGFEELFGDLETLDALLLNNDAFPLPGCIAALARQAEAGNVGIVGPLSTDHGHQSIHKDVRRRGWTKELLDWYATGDKRDLAVGAKLLAAVPRMSQERMVAFFCTWIRRDCLEQIGWHRADGALASGLGGDDEHCHRARKAGWQVVLAHHALCEHWHKTSFRKLGFNRAGLQADAIRQLRAEGVI